MANAEHLAVIERGVAPWNRWREENAGQQPDLQAAELAGRDLSGADLRSASLRGADLCRANLYGARCGGADFSHAKLTEADLSGADLSAAILQRANLIGARFPGADLRGAQFKGADLRGADLRGADLRGANFHAADLMRVRFAGAQLGGVQFRGADLRGANLRGVDLSKADLRGANLREAELLETVFGNVDLSRTNGLDQCNHLGPSVLDARTLLEYGPVPLSFLRGCGVPERLISLVPTLLNAPGQFHSCFICHGQNDKPFARRLHDQLQTRGVRCWSDERPAVADEDGPLGRGSRLWDKTLLCCSRDVLANGWVDAEIEASLDRERKLAKERGKKTSALLVLDLDGCLSGGPGTGDRMVQLEARLAAGFMGWESGDAEFEAGLEKLLLALSASTAPML